MIKLEFSLNKLENATPFKAVMIGTALKGTTQRRDIIHLYNKNKQLLAAGIVASCEALEYDNLRIEVAALSKIAYNECAYAIVYEKSQPKSFFAADLYEMGVVLQGGGMKGAFGVGAIHFLTVAGIIKPERRLSIAAASTGSITSLLLAQNNGLATSLAAIQQYTSMKGIGDMLELRSEVKAKMKRSAFINDVVDKLLKTGSINFQGIDLKKIVEDKNDNRWSSSIRNGAIAGAVGGPLAGLAAGITTMVMDVKEDIETEAKEIQGLFNVDYSLAHITPVMQRLKQLAGDDLYEKLEAKRTELRLAVVSVLSGAVCYITEKLELLHPKEGAHYEGFDYSNYEAYKIVSLRFLSEQYSGDGNHTDRLIKSVLASAAFPGLFEPVQIEYMVDGMPRTDLFFDGGVKDNLPLEILTKDTDLKNIIGIYCSPLPNLPAERDTNRKSWVSMIQIATDEIMNENARMDSEAGRAINVSDFNTDEGSAHVVHIAPNVPTLGLTQVSPYAIRNTIWYGYMRAFDEMFISENRSILSKDNVFLLRNLSDKIYDYFDLLFEAGRRLIRESAYRIPVKKDEYGQNDKHKYSIGLSISDEDRIKYVDFHEQSLISYLSLKLGIIDAIIRKYELVKSINQTSFSTQHMFCSDQVGFMQKTLYTDWFGVFDYIHECDWAAVKKQRTLDAFKKELFAQKWGYFKTTSDQIFKNNAAKPLVETDTSPSWILRKSILERMNKYKQLFEGNDTDLL